MKTLRYFLLATALILFLLVVMGNVVRVSNAAGACPDWPTCFGQFSFPEQTLARLQVIHRLLAALSSLMILASSAWAWRLRAPREVQAPLWTSIPLMGVEVALGAGLTVPGPAFFSAIHLSLGLVGLGLAVAAVMAAFSTRSGLSLEDFAPVLSGEMGEGSRNDVYSQQSDRVAPHSPGRLSLAAGAAVLTVLVSGAMIAASGAGKACTGLWLCGGGWPVSAQGWLELAHRAATLAAVLLVGWAFWQAWRRQRSQRVVLSAVTAAFILLLGQALIGAAKVSRGFPADLVGLHAASSAALWAVVVVWIYAEGAARRKEPDLPGLLASLPRRSLRDFLLLNKPVIVLLLLVTTYAGMVLGAHQLPGLALTAWTLLGGALAAGGSSALNQYIDRELDKHMQRTARRPLPSGRLTAAEGLAYGLGACLAAFFILAVFVNLLAALLSLAGMIYYVLLYSIWLKKLTVQNIVIGGGAGAIPPLVGWAAASGSLNIPSLFLFAIVFLWTPPHFWALALVRRNDYARAGVPMLPVVQGEKATRWQILVYTLELVGLTLLMPVLRITGSIFLFSALALGAWLLSTAWRVWKQGGNKAAWMMYRYSSMYLAFIFLALVMDVLI